MKKIMEKGKSRSSSASTRTPKVERKITEKNRRNRMKDLYSNLFSLLPDHGSKKAMPLPDQVDEVVAYIQNLEINVEKMKEKKEEFLLPRKRSSSCITNEIQAHTKSSTVPFVEVQDMGPNMDVILVTGLDDLSKFYTILKRLLHEDGIEVANANFCSTQGNSIIQIQILHDKVGKSRSMGVGVTTMSTRLKDLIYAISTCSEVESNITDLRDSHEIQSQLWGFGNLEFIQPYMSLECYQGYM